MNDILYIIMVVAGVLLIALAIADRILVARERKSSRAVVESYRPRDVWAEKGFWVDSGNNIRKS
jgi:hypothetical protein